MLDLVPNPEEQPVRRPSLHGSVVVRAAPEDVLDAAAGDLFAQAVACVRRFGDFHLAVAVGPALDRLYTRLMCDPTYRALPWKRTHLWLVEEAGVPESDARSRYGAMRESLVEHSDIPPEQAHPIGSGPGAAAEYESLLRETLGWREKGHDRLDAVLLELESGGVVAGVRDGAEEPGLMTARGVDPRVAAMTAAFLNASRFIAVLALGAGRAADVRALSGGGPGAPPASRLRPLGGELRWYLDRAACGPA
ncbi:MAG: hypothetical protein FJ255_12250 [Phycisphaerae bacterium]|nr:hypothetical protein [Phycisphaerae bacterium]